VLERLELRQLLSLTPAQPSTPTPRGDGPTVVAVQRFGFHAQPTLVVLQFNEPLDPVPAQNPSNYIIQNFKSRPVGIRSAVYDPATDTVLLRPGQRLNLHHPAQLLVMGTSPTGLTNTNGILLDGADTGQPGSNFSTFLRRRNLAGPAPFGASANL
jgi:type VI secretion system secreted protein VgrG